VKLIIVGCILVVVIGAIAFGFFSKLSELKDVWKSLRDQFGVSEDRFTERKRNQSILGKLQLLEQEFVGGIDVVRDGLLFSHEFADHRELIHFPKERIRDLRASPDGSTASFSLVRNSGLDVSVTVTWSQEMSDKWAAVVRNYRSESDRS
jgi:hypothetical protein